MDILIIRVVIMCREYLTAFVVEWVCSVEHIETIFILVYSEGLFGATKIHVGVIQQMYSIGYDIMCCVVNKFGYTEGFFYGVWIY